MNIPNALTIFRFLLVPIFIYTFYFQNGQHYLIPLIIFLLAGVTDILDGYIARKYNMITNWGKLMDPLADKVMQISVLLVMTDKKFIPTWIILIVILKELFLIIGGTVLYRNKVIVQANWYGKLTTVMFYIAIILIIFTNSEFGKYVIVAAVFTSLYSVFRYTLHYSPNSKNTKFTVQNNEKT